MSERIWYLKRCDLFHRIAPDQVHWLESQSRMRTFPRKSLVYAHGDRADGVFLLASGQVKIYTITNDGKQAILAFMEPGEVFGELAVVEPDARQEYAEASETSTVILIPAEAMRHLMENHAIVSVAVTKLMGLRRRRLEKRLKSLLFRSNRERLVNALLELAEEYGTPVSGGIELGIRLSHQDLANLIGSTRESVTIALGELQAKKYLRIGRRRVVLTNPHALAQSIHASPPNLAGLSRKALES